MRRVGLLLAAAAAAGCTQVPIVSEVPGDPLTPVLLAAREPEPNLRRAAGRGDTQAAMALALVYTHGLNGVPPDEDQALLWVRRAGERRQFQQITTYIAGLNGAPGRVSTTLIPSTGSSRQERLRPFLCSLRLRAQAEGRLVDETPACGSPAREQFLLDAWRPALAPAGPRRTNEQQR